MHTLSRVEWMRRWLKRLEESVLGRTLTGRRLERPVEDEQGHTLFEPGREIDRRVLDRAREEDRLEELAHAAEPGTSDSELEELLWWRKHRHEEDRPKREEP